MSCCGGGGPNATANKQINKELEQDRKNAKTNVKILLLGAGESGKSTVAKQMKIIHLNGFTDEERKGWKSIITKNVVYSMRILVKQSGEFAAYDQRYVLQPNNMQNAGRIMNKMDPSFGGTDPILGPAEGALVKYLWNDPGIRATYDRRSEYQLNDSAVYFFDQIDRISHPAYIPTEQDVLRARVRTSGIIETSFVLEDFHFSIIDVGGQRSERRKWIHCFQDVTAILYCVSLSEYDLRLFEDTTVNRMHESLQLWTDVVNGDWFVKTAMIVFLNKVDLFREKLTRVPLGVCFPDYQGDNSYEHTTAFIEQKFRAQSNNPAKQLYFHLTCATDTENVKFVFNAARTIIMKSTLQSLSMYT